MEVSDDTSQEAVQPSRSSTPSSSLSLGSSQGLRPATAPVATSGTSGFGDGHIPPRAIRTAPAARIDSNDQNVRVVARVRPLSSRDIDENSGESIAADTDLDSIRVVDTAWVDGGRRFEFDSVFGPSSTQEEVYERTCGDMISSSVFKGFNATILAYGQTGSGKTFTMGTNGSSASPDSEGVIARAVRDLFSARDSLPDGDGRVKVTLSYLEIYNEQAIDLLNDDPSSASAPLQVRDSKTEGVVIPNLRHFPVSSTGEVRSLMARASERRATGSTHMNSVSSRSHAICTLNVIITPHSGGSQAMKAKLTLVDLAGSERMKRTGAEGARMKEGISINKGLFVLGQVVSALSEIGQRNGSPRTAHIPYRDSKLTRLLQDSLGGNSRTVMIACISPAESNVEESINTLRYAERARSIKNSAVRNVVSTSLSPGEVAALCRENQQLKVELARMEAMMNVPNNTRATVSTGGFPFGVRGPVDSASNDNEETETAFQLRTQCTSLLAEIDILQSHARGHAEEALEASLRADKWQARSEAISRLAIELGVDLPKEMKDHAVLNDEGLVSQLRKQLAKCRAELLEARTEAAVARAAAGAILIGKCDASNIDEAAIANGEDALTMTPPSKEDNAQEKRLRTELSAVVTAIEQKEASVLQMNRESVCMDNLRQHFEASLRLLQEEVDVLTAERNELITKASSGEGEYEGGGGSNTAPQQPCRGKRAQTNDVTTKSLRDQIAKLEERISELKVNADEHRRSLRMRVDAERRCARLAAEIVEDKRRRAELQRKLKEASAEMRAEKKTAQQRAARMMKDSQKLKFELMKMKSAADKQTAVLKRKIDQASAKERARLELERKRRSAAKRRLDSSSSTDGPKVKEGRKAELTSWVDSELEHSVIRSQIAGQKHRLDDLVSDRRKMMKESGDTVDIDELDQMDATIRSLRVTIHDLEGVARKAFPASANGSSNPSSAFPFLETDTFKGLSRTDSKYAMSYIFAICSSLRLEAAATSADREAANKSAVDSALANERVLHEKDLTKIRMEHADATFSLLQSTKCTVNSNIKLKMGAGETETVLKAQMEDILGGYNESWHSSVESLKSDIDKIKVTQEGLQTMLDGMVNGAFVPQKPKAKKKRVIKHGYVSDVFESEESLMDDGDGEDSEYEPTPQKDAKRNKKKRQSPRAATNKKVLVAPNSQRSPIGENFLNDIDRKRVGSLKKACRKLGVPVTGKKAVLKQRVRESILNSSIAAMPDNQDEDGEGCDDSFDAGSSALKRVIFEGDMAADPKFHPIDDGDDVNNTNLKTQSLNKKLWDETVASEACSKEAKEKPESSESASVEMTNKTLPPEKSTTITPPKKTTPKRHMLGFLTSSPRPLAPHNARNPVHPKQTTSTAKKRLVPEGNMQPVTTLARRNNVTLSSKKLMKRGMANAVSRALQQAGRLP